MNDIGQKPTDREMETVIGNLLRAGVIIAASVVLLGGIIYLFHHGFEPVGYKVFLREPFDLCNVSGIIQNALSWHGRGLIQLGLLLLIATPIARVALSIFEFARKRDTLYVVITLIVFFILVYSLLGR
jgi:uncharacterized membrane protein